MFKEFNIALTIVVVILLLIPGTNWIVGTFWMFGVAGLWLVYLIKKKEEKDGSG